MPLTRPKAPKFTSGVLLTTTIYLTLLLTQIFTTLLYTSCIPLKPSQNSATHQFHALSLSTSTTEIAIGNFALCASGTGNNDSGGTHCAVSRMKKASDVVKLLGGKIAEADVEAAVKLQKKVFFGIPVVSSLFTFFTLLSIIIAQFLGSSKFLPKIKFVGLVFGGLAVAIMLVDAFSAELALSALEIATGVVIKGQGDGGGQGAKGQFDGYVFRRGMYYMVFQWLSFALGLIGVGVLGSRGVVGRAPKS